MLSLLLFYASIGMIVGVLAGLFGVGGGTVIVPVIALSLKSMNVPDDLIMKMSLGTSFATITFTSISSIIAHHQRGAVQWFVVNAMTPGLILGVVMGGLYAVQLSNQILKYIFVIFAGLSVLRLLWPQKIIPSDEILRVPLFILSLVGSLIGFISALIGIGGGLLTVPFLHRIGYNIRSAIASSAACGFPLAGIGAITYLYTGWQLPDLPDYSLGYIYLPGLLGLISTSILFAPLGAGLAHYLPVARLRLFFALFLILMLIRLLW